MAAEVTIKNKGAIGMSRVPLWKAIREQATAWRATSAFQRFSAELPRNASQRVTGLSGALQQIEAGGGWVSSHPLQLASYAPMMLDLIPGLDPGSLGGAWTAWHGDAQSVESAHRDTIAWMRSRLPGYPLLPVPQLAPGTPLTTVEYTSRLTWARSERSHSLQFKPAPRQTGVLLQATENQRRDLDESARKVITAFEETEEWQRFAVATEELDDHARSSLRSIRATLRQRLALDAVNAYEPDLAMRRDEYRKAMLSEEIGKLSGSAREYVDAFDVIDRLMESIASDVFGQLATYSEPIALTPPQELDLLPESPRAVTFTLLDYVWPEIGSIAWVDHPLTPDAIRITTVTMRHNAASGSTLRVTGKVLEDTAAAWRPVA